MRFDLHRIITGIKSVAGKELVALEIDDDWIKIAESGLLGGRRVITRVRLIRLAEIEGPLNAALTGIFNELKVSGENVIVSLPRHLVTVRILELPSSEPREISAMVNLQIGKQTPYSKEEVIFGYKVVTAKREGYTGVMLAIARHAIVKERVEALQAALGVGAGRVTFSTEGVCEWFKTVYPQNTPSDGSAVALLDVDSNYSDFVVMRGGRIASTRSISIGASGPFTMSSGEWREKFAEELKHCEELYSSEARGAKITRAYLSGAPAAAKDLNAILAACLGVPCEYLDSLKNTRLKDSASTFLKIEKYKYVSLSALFGFLTEDQESAFDLTTPEAKIQRAVEQKREGLTVTGVLAASIVTLISMLLFVGISYQGLYLSQLKNKIVQVEKDADQVERMHGRMGLIEKWRDARGSSLNMLNEVNRLLPREIFLTSVEIEDKQTAALKGNARVMSDVFKFVSLLESSELFTNVKTKYTTARKEQNSEYTEFQITCEYAKRKR